MNTLHFTQHQIYNSSSPFETAQVEHTLTHKSVSQQAVREAATICPAPCKLTFDLESAVQVTCDVGYLCAKFGLSRPLFFRLRPDVRDRQTDRQTSLDTHHRLMRPPYGGGDIIKTATVYYDYYLRVLLNQTISGDHCRSGWSGVSKQDPLAIAGQLEGAMSSNQPCHSSRAIVITEPAAAVLPLPPKKKISI